MLAVGSPALAGYTLVLTVLNSHWVMRRFYVFKQASSEDAMRALKSLQQAPLKVATQFGLVNSLVMLRENDMWWAHLVDRLDYTHTWSISAVTNLIWVAIAFVFIVVDAFRNLRTENYQTRGEAVGVVWLWLLPVVIGWLQISPKCDAEQLEKAVHDANSKAYHLPTPEGIIRSDARSRHLRALTLHEEDRGLLYMDQQCTCPIFNYSRAFSWAEAAATIAQAYERADKRISHGHPQSTLELGLIGRAYDEVAWMSALQIQDDLWVSGVWKRIGAASVMGLLLLWSTAGAAFMLAWLTPTQGLGCRAGSYLLYGTLATVVWFLMLMSSILVRCEELSSSCRGHAISDHLRHRRLPPGWAGTLAVVFRRTGKILALCNTAWITCACMFQFSGFYSRCWCNSSVMSHHSNAYAVLELVEADYGRLRGAWAGGVVLSTIYAVLFYLFINLYLHQPPRVR
ncbi:hypothetical protein K525DRAFT_282006 [Schizophyllum commune Loenen D]|nr:hypothetical protein K525DRAFT_282006 [Schizophyllum commune Loenen D]